MKTIYTIGHSTHNIAYFIAMLQGYDINMLADVRTVPGSARFPQFNKAALEQLLKANNISYLHFPGLGGKRKPTAVNNPGSFGGYEAYMQTDEFKKSIEQLQAIAINTPVAFMCAEALWSNCHRSFIAHYLAAQGWRVVHIISRDKGLEHPGPPPARPVQGDLFSDITV